MCLISDIGFEVPDAFLVGYALDYNEYFRDLSVSDLFTTSKIGNPLISFVYYVYMAPAIIGGALSCQSQMCLQVDYLHILEFSDWLVDVLVFLQHICTLNDGAKEKYSVWWQEKGLLPVNTRLQRALFGIILFILFLCIIPGCVTTGL